MNDGYTPDWADDIDDRGKTEYFHGREEVLGAFRKRLQFTVDDSTKGTTFLIQAAPGAGKTALLYECARRARKRGWETLKINTKTLWDTDAMCQLLERWEVWRALLDTIAIEAGFDKWIKGGAGAKFKLPGHTPESIIRLGKSQLLLVLDEAQTLGGGMTSSDARHETVKVFLDRLHNGNMGRPMMLLVAGLGGTKVAFQKMGVSRFKPGCCLDLEHLKPNEERRVIADWLQLEGKARGDIRPWVDAIMAETHGWPQHIACYAQAAALQVRADRRRMTPNGLNVVMETGRKERTKFYKARVQGIQDSVLRCIAHRLREVPPRYSFAREYLTDALTDAYGESKAEELFRRMVHKGVLEEFDNMYVIPIPSMQVWLVENFGRGQPPLFRPPPDRPLSM